jgi:hypothetical protein
MKNIGPKTPECPADCNLIRIYLQPKSRLHLGLISPRGFGTTGCGLAPKFDAQATISGFST